MIPVKKDKPEFRNKLKVIFDSEKMRELVEALPVEEMVKRLRAEKF
jgi:hypothetical protein